MSGDWRREFVPILSLAGVLLDALGGLYLGYDLLGGKNGPLRLVTKSASYGVMFGIAYGLPLGMWFGLVGLLVSGPALSIEIRHRGIRDFHPFIGALVLGLSRAAGFGVAGWLSKDLWFGINFGILSAVAFVATYVIVGPPTNTDSEHPRIDRVVLKRAAFRAASIGLAAILSGVVHKESHALAYGVEVGLVIGISSGILVAVAPAVETWVDNLPDRRLGGYGAILVLIGSLLQAVQYVLPLAGRRGT
ncbi:MAG TPA: hypothetical protein VHY56_04850 [Candidatus Binataceae bacterium]|nr:hypothetical protein [Candidatus Binataceae bacterium]